MNAAELGLARRQAMLFFDDGRFPEAEARLDDLIARTGRCGALEEGVRAQVLSDRATVRRASAKWKLALEDLVQLESLMPKLPTVMQRGMYTGLLVARVRTLTDAALTAEHDEEHDQLLADAQQSLAALRTQVGESWEADGVQARIHARLGQWDEAARLALRAASSLSRLGWEGAVAAQQRLAGDCLLEMGEVVRARSLIVGAYDVLERGGSPIDTARSRLTMARLRTAEGDPESGWRFTLAALERVALMIRGFRTPGEQRRFMREQLEVFDIAFELGLAGGGQTGVARAWTIAEHAKSFYLAQLLANADVPLFDGVARSDVARVASLEKEMDRLERQLHVVEHDAEHAAAVRDALARTSAERAHALEVAMKANPRWGAARSPPLIELTAALGTLDPSWRPVGYFWRGARPGATRRDTLHVFYLGLDGRPALAVTEWTREEMGRLLEHCDRLRGVVPPERSVIPDGLGDRLLPAIVRAELRDGQRLLVSPHRQLRALPLHALPEGDGVLGMRWPVQYVPSLALLSLPRRTAASDAVLVLGAPANVFQADAVHGIREAVENVRRLWEAKRPQRVKSRIIEREETLEGSDVAVEHWGEFGVLHVVCHGFFEPGRPMDAALRLGADAIRASELFAARLRATLLTLCACSLGHQGDDAEHAGEDWVALYLALFYAGADRLLVSLWDANAEVADELMESLHGALAESVAVPEAYAGALRAVRRKSPAMWANWCLAGIPT